MCRLRWASDPENSLPQYWHKREPASQETSLRGDGITDIEEATKPKPENSGWLDVDYYFIIMIMELGYIMNNPAGKNKFLSLRAPKLYYR